MPIPSVKPREEESEFVSRCISDIIDEYGQEQAAAICYAQYENDTQGGVASSMSEEFARTKFTYPPKHKEQMTSFMSRCMSNALVKERKSNRGVRAGFCYSQYQTKYLSNIGKSWK